MKQKGNTYEAQYDDTTWLYGTIQDVDPGPDQGPYRSVLEVSVVAYVGGFDEDVTGSLSPKRLEYFREWLEEKINEGAD